MLYLTVITPGGQHRKGRGDCPVCGNRDGHRLAFDMTTDEYVCLEDGTRWPTVATQRPAPRRTGPS